MKYATLLSSSYSGSTILSMLVCSHPKVIGFGDTYNYQYVRLHDTKCTCGAIPSSTCPVRVEIEHEMRELGQSFQWTTSSPTPIPERLRINRLAVSLSRRTQLRQMYRCLPRGVRETLCSRFYSENLSFMSALRSLEEYEWYFDGCKNLVRLDLLQSVIPIVKVVHLIRNPNSYLHSQLKRGRENYRRIVKGWLRYNTVAHRYQETHGSNGYLLVRYEDLVKDPKIVIGDICDFLGLPHLAVVALSAADKERIHVVGNRAKEKFSAVEDRSVDWREALGSEQLAYVAERTRSLNWLQAVYP